MTTIILVALILLLVCTAAGLIFLAVTISDRADEKVIKNAGEGDDDYYANYVGAHAYATGGHSARRAGRLSKKSGVELWGTKTRIVSFELKRDFENTLAEMKQTGEAAAEKMAIQAEEVFNESEIIDNADEFIFDDADEFVTAWEGESETEFIDVFDLVNEGGLKGVAMTGFQEEDDDFFLEEEVLG